MTKKKQNIEKMSQKYIEDWKFLLRKKEGKKRYYLTLKNGRLNAFPDVSM